MNKKDRYAVQGASSLFISISCIGIASGLYYDSWRFAGIGICIATTVVFTIIGCVNIALWDKPE